jgi:hypothetical protein
MDDNISISQGPNFAAGYVPYFYQSGKFLLYNTPYKASKSQDISGTGHYDFTSDLVPNKAAYLKSQTVEDIILSGYFAIPKSDPELALISDKTHTSKIGLDDIIGQIRGRYLIYEKNMYQIEMSKCYAVSSQFAVESARGGIGTSSKEAYGLTKTIGELYLQQCDERRGLWADISKLKLNLPEQAQSYLSSYRKLAILEEGEAL